MRRFVAALGSSPPSAADEAWALAWLSERERLLWTAQSARDRRHTIAVARTVVRAPAGEAAALEEWVVPAALLHDVGKADAPLGVVGRVAATLVELVGGERPGARLATRRGVLGTIGRYLDYPARGAATLEGVGAHPLVSAWAREHHLPRAQRTVPEPWASRLATADHTAV